MKELRLIKLDDLIPDPEQPRKAFNEEKLQELAESIRALGVQQAITVRLNPKADEPGQPTYMIIAGERRFRASKLADKEYIPAILVEDAEDPNQVYSWQLTENLHRVDLNPVEKAEFLNNHIEYLKSQGVENAAAKVAENLGVSPSWVSKKLSVLKYDEEIRRLARFGKLRDYGLLKKVSELKPEKRKEAVDLIERGEFKSNDFFARKRYDKKKTVEKNGSAEESSPGEGVTHPIAQPVRVGMLPGEWVRLIDKTDFRHILDSAEPDWRFATSTMMKHYIEKFKEWALGE